MDPTTPFSGLTPQLQAKMREIIGRPEMQNLLRQGFQPEMGAIQRQAMDEMHQQMGPQGGGLSDVIPSTPEQGARLERLRGADPNEGAYFQGHPTVQHTIRGAVDAPISYVRGAGALIPGNDPVERFGNYLTESANQDYGSETNLGGSLIGYGATGMGIARGMAGLAKPLAAAGMGRTAGVLTALGAAASSPESSLLKVGAANAALDLPANMVLAADPQNEGSYLGNLAEQTAMSGAGAAGFTQAGRWLGRTRVGQALMRAMGTPLGEQRGPIPDNPMEYPPPSRAFGPGNDLETAPSAFNDTGAQPLEGVVPPPLLQRQSTIPPEIQARMAQRTTPLPSSQPLPEAPRPAPELPFEQRVAQGLEQTRGMLPDPGDELPSAPRQRKVKTKPKTVNELADEQVRADQELIAEDARVRGAKATAEPTAPVAGKGAEPQGIGPETTAETPQTKNFYKAFDDAAVGEGYGLRGIRDERLGITTLQLFDKTGTPLGQAKLSTVNGAIYLQKLDALTRGGGRQLMERLATAADKAGVEMFGEVLPTEPAKAKVMKVVRGRPTLKEVKGGGVKMEPDKLHAWYKQFGFEPSGVGPDAVVRKPNAPKPVAEVKPKAKRKITVKKAEVAAPPAAEKVPEVAPKEATSDFWDTPLENLQSQAAKLKDVRGALDQSPTRINSKLDPTFNELHAKYKAGELPGYALLREADGSMSLVPAPASHGGGPAGDDPFLPTGGTRGPLGSKPAPSGSPSAKSSQSVNSVDDFVARYKQQLESPGTSASIDEVAEAQRLAASRPYADEPSYSYASVDERTRKLYDLTNKPQPLTPRSIKTTVEDWLKETFVPRHRLKGPDTVGRVSRSRFFAVADDVLRQIHSVSRDSKVKAAAILQDWLAPLRDTNDLSVLNQYAMATERMEAIARTRLASDNAKALQEATRVYDQTMRMVKEGTLAADPTMISRLEADVAKAEHAVRFGPSPESLEAGIDEAAVFKDYQNLRKLVLGSERLTQAWKNQVEMMRAFRQHFVDTGEWDESARLFYYPHQIVDLMRRGEDFYRYSKIGNKAAAAKSTYGHRRTGKSMRDVNRDYINVMYEYLGDMLEKMERGRILREIAGRYDLRNPDVQSSFADDLSKLGVDVTKGPWKAGDPLPRDWVEWRVRQGRGTGRLETLPERMHDVTFDAMATDPVVAKAFENATGLKLDGSMDDVLARIDAPGTRVGKDVYYIPRDLMHELDEVTREMPDNTITRLAKKYMQLQKSAWLHLAPLRYNLRNMWSDIPRAIAQFGVDDIKGSRQDWEDAIGSVWNKYVHGTEDEFWRKAQQYNVTSAGATATEFGKARDMREIRRLSSSSKALTDKILGGRNPIRELARLPVTMSQLREDILRMYIFQMNVKKAVGISDPDAMVKAMNLGIVDPEVAHGLARDVPTEAPWRLAAHISREAMGDYGNLTKSETFVRNFLVPFYSWMKMNPKFYLHDLPKAIRRGTVSPKNAVAGTATKAAEGTVVVAATLAAIRAWNSYAMGEAEEYLPEGTASRGHIILPDLPHFYKTGELRPLIEMTPEGHKKFAVMGLPDAFDDILDFVGLNDVGQDIRPLLEGRITPEEFVTRRVEGGKPVRAFASKLFNSSSAALPINVLGLGTYPDIFDPRQVKGQDRLNAGLRTLGLEGVMPDGIMDYLDPTKTPSTTKGLLDVGYREPQATMFESYRQDLFYRMRKLEQEISDEQGTLGNIASGLGYTNLDADQRREALNRAVLRLQAKAAEMQRLGQRFSQTKARQ